MNEANEAFTPEEMTPVKETPVKQAILDDVWRPLGAWPGTVPKPRKWLVVRPVLDNTQRGVLPLGKVGLLAGAGAAGKSWLTTQLAVAVAAKKKWIGLDIATPGRVLLVLGEEEHEEAMRRLYYAGEMMELSLEQKQAAAENLVILPMAGRDMALTERLEIGSAASGGLPKTKLFDEIQQRLNEEAWSLVVLDPLSRFAGADVETDNAAATRFIQVLEQLTQAPGSPTVLVTHHTTKSSRKEGTGEADAAAATAQRGASALTDGVRWQANLDGRERIDGAPRLIDFRVVKTNYGPPVSLMTLTGPEASHGALRLSTEEEIERWDRAKRKAKDDKSSKDDIKSDKKARGYQGIPPGVNPDE